MYQALKRFQLSGEVVVAENMVLKRDRAEMTFNGTFYLEEPVGGRVRGAVFVGKGTFRAEAPPSKFERDNLHRLLNAEVVESDFQTAVLRFTDDSAELIGRGARPARAVDPVAQKLAAERIPRMLRETGANISARTAVSILNEEEPGFFIAEFDKGRRHRFTLLLDFQGRIPVANFGINAGEKGLIFAYRDYDNDVWMAFYALQDYDRGRVQYSDVFDAIAIDHYKMEIDLREPKKFLKLAAQMELRSRVKNLLAIPLAINEGLGEAENERLKKALRLKSARLAGGAPLEAAQEDWEGGLTLFLPAAKGASEKFVVELELEGDFLYDTESFSNGHYPLSDTTWYPRHGFLGRSTFELTFRHSKKLRVASCGLRTREEPNPANKDEMITEFRIDKPVALVTFALAPFERHSETVKWKEGGELPVEFYSLSGQVMAIKEDFILAELMNCVQYFSALFGKYPYPSFRATFHPFSYGQGFPTMLMIPATDRASKFTYSFVAHETSHQWWGDIVAWRSYRDQWLSEGFAEYAGVLYTGLRDKHNSSTELIRDMRTSLKDPPQTATGLGKGRLVDVGPIILGHRLSTRETRGAYTTLIYNKGGLVLRMLHFLFTDPSTGRGDAFFDMMADFVKRHADGWASTENFMQVANEHFPRTPIAQKFGLKDLNWFFRQWVYQAYLPSYRLAYQLENQPDGSVLLRGTVFQDNVPEAERWFMPLPVRIQAAKDKFALGTVYALGPQAPFTVKLTFRPEQVELDPDMWVLSEKTSTTRTK